MLTFHETDKKFELQGDLLKMTSNMNYKVDVAKISDKKVMFDFAKEMYFDKKSLGIRSTRVKSLIRLLKSPAIKASGFSTIFLPENLVDSCDRLKLLLPEKQDGKKSNIINEEIVAIADELSEYK